MRSYNDEKFLRCNNAKNFICSALSFSCLLLVSGCNALETKGCEGMKWISSSDLVKMSINKIVNQSNSKIAGEMKYSGIADFQKINSPCCYIQKPGNFRENGFSLPIKYDRVEIAIIYRKYEDIKKPLRVRYVSIGMCPNDVDYTETNTSLKVNSDISTINWGRKII